MRVDRSWGRAVGLAIVCALGACRVVLTPPSPGGPGGTGPASAQKQLAALLSVYYHANEAALGIYAPDDAPYRPLSVVEAAQLLRADDSGNGKMRQRRSAAKLAAADIGRPAFRQALAILLDHPEAGEPFRDAAAMIETIEMVFATHPGLDVPQKEALVSDLLETTYGPAVPGCHTRHLTTNIQCGSDPSTAAVTFGTVSVDVLRAASDIARGFDGQSWDACSSLFGPTYVAAEILGSYPFDKNYDAYPEPHPPEPGSSWKGVLFETAQMAWRDFKLSQFKTLLNVGATWGGTRSIYVFDYGLRQSIWSSVFGVSSLDGILRDFGYLSIPYTIAGWSHVENTKTVQFSNPILNAAACALLGAKSDAAVELACCNPPMPLPRPTATP